MEFTETTDRKENQVTTFSVWHNEGPSAFLDFVPTEKGQYLRFAYEARVDSHASSTPDMVALERLFHADNMAENERPATMVRSLSVGDIVLNETLGIAYKVGTVGFSVVAYLDELGNFRSGFRAISRHTVWNEATDQPRWVAQDGTWTTGEAHCDLKARQAAKLEEASA